MFFAQALEEARAHAFAEEDTEEAQGEALRRVASRGAEADGEVGLFDVAGFDEGVLVAW